MIQLYETGAYLLNGTELVADTPDAQAVLQSKLGSAPSKRGSRKRIPLPMGFWLITIHQAIWKSFR